MLWNKKSEVAGSVSVRCKCVTRPLGWSKLSWGARWSWRGVRKMGSPCDTAGFQVVGPAPILAAPCWQIFPLDGACLTLTIKECHPSTEDWNPRTAWSYVLQQHHHWEDPESAQSKSKEPGQRLCNCRGQRRLWTECGCLQRTGGKRSQPGCILELLMKRCRHGRSVSGECQLSNRKKQNWHETRRKEEKVGVGKSSGGWTC